MYRKLFTISALTLALAACSTCDEETMVNSDCAMDGQYAAGSNDCLIAEAGNTVYFDFNSSHLGNEARATLDRQAAWFAKYNCPPACLEGHCDERGTSEYNLALGERRADSAKNYLVNRGVDGSRLTTVSYGKERPVDPAHNEAAWAKNRRVVTVIQ